MKVNVTITKKENAVRDLEITVDKADVIKEFDSSIKEINKKARIPGFRPGKVPAAILKKKFLPNIKYSVINEIVPKALQQALDDNDLKAFSQPSFDEIENIDENEDFTFKASFEVQSTIEVGDYKELIVKKNSYSFEKKKVADTIENMRKSQGTEKPKEGEIAEGDVCLLEYAYYINDDDEKVKRTAVAIVNEDDLHFKHIHKELLGMKKDDEKEIKLKIPDKYPDEELAGKKGKMDVKIISVSEIDVPALDDEFAKDVGFENLEQLNLDVEKKLEQQCSEKERNELTDEIIDAVIENSTFDIPLSLIDNQTNQSLYSTMGYLQQTGQSFESFLMNQDMDRDQFLADQKEKAKKHIKRYLILDEIAKKEKIEVTDADVNAYLTKYTEDNEAALTKIKADYEKKEVKDAVDGEVLFEKVFDFLIENSKVGKGEKKKL